MHPSQLPVDQLERQCSVEFLRRGGPGGQHRNKVETACLITHLPTGAQAEANERRSQAANRREAIGRLRRALAIEHRSSPLPPAESSRSLLWQNRCRNGRMMVAHDHEDFPALLAESLDVLAASQWDSSTAANRLMISSSQLVKLLRLEPLALRQVNRHREILGLHPLR